MNCDICKGGNWECCVYINVNDGPSVFDCGGCEWNCCGFCIYRNLRNNKMSLGLPTETNPPKLTELEERAWKIYCKETAGSMDARDYWEQLPKWVQNIYLEEAESMMRTFLAVDLDTLWPLCRKVYGEGTRINFEVLKEVLYCLTDEFAEHDMRVYTREEPKPEFIDVLHSLGYNPIVHLKQGFTPMFDDIRKSRPYTDHIIIACGEVNYSDFIFSLQLNYTRPTKVHVITFETDLTKNDNDTVDNKVFLTENIVYR